MMHILTFADSKFFPMAYRMARNILKFPEYRLYLYDLGLGAKQREELCALGVLLEQTDFPSDTFSMNNKNNIRTTHKIYCIEHFLRKYAEPVLVLDADILILEDIADLIPPGKNGFVVTRRHAREQKPHILINGKINAGVMAFGPDVPSALFREWKELCLNSEHTDQSALSWLLEQEIDLDMLDIPQPFMQSQVVVRDGNIYNDVTCRTGKLFHFKSAGRRPVKMLSYKLFAAIQHCFPRTVSWLVRCNRKHRVYVWRS